MTSYSYWIRLNELVTVIKVSKLNNNYIYFSKTRTYIWDVRDLQKPVLANTYVANNTVIDHNQYIRGDFVFQSNYEAGLRILYLDSKNYNLTEVAYFDILPSSNAVRFAGTWSNYPYFEQGNL